MALYSVIVMSEEQTMTNKSPVIGFLANGRPVVLGSAANSIRAAGLLGCGTAEFARIREFGYAYVSQNPQDVARRIAWNRA